MAAAKSPKKSSKKPTPAGAQLDIVFSGPLLFVPTISEGAIISVDVYSPKNDHPVGAVFVPGVIYPDKDLEHANPDTWPDPEAFSLLDPHSYAIELAQAGTHTPFPASSIPELNHKIRPGRKISSDWTVALSLYGQLAAWTSHRYFKMDADLYCGSDTPLATAIPAMQRLTYKQVTAAEFYGARTEPREYLRANIASGGTLIVTGEIPYQASLAHERLAIDALARLAGLDLHLAEIAPNPHRSRLMMHVTNCGHSVIVA
jgi:hypothetical protein